MTPVARDAGSNPAGETHQEAAHVISPVIVLNPRDAEQAVARGWARPDHVLVSPALPQEVVMPPKKTTGGRKTKKPGALPGSAAARRGSSSGGRKSKRGKNKS